MKGFLGTGAMFAADLNLLVQISMGLMLLVGFHLARRKKFRAHGICQATVMLLNLVMIALVMSPAFRPVRAQLPAGLRDSYYAVATAHASLGGAAELLGLYIVLVAGTNLVPQRLRFQRWKLWMRAELALWWLVIFFGLGTYYVWYMTSVAKGVPRAAGTGAGRTIIRATNFDFTPKEVTVRVGTTVTWVDDTGRHTVLADDGSFQSTVLTAGGRFEHTFTQPGTFAYHCGFHGSAGGKNMAGAVKVVPR